jgi:hypothetical protein
MLLEPLLLPPCSLLDSSTRTRSPRVLPTKWLVRPLYTDSGDEQTVEEFSDVH